MAAAVKTSRKSANDKRGGVRPPRKAAARIALGLPSNLSKREQGASERRKSIVAAGLAEFTAKGFANTRLDDVARRAGVAKGTIYLHFKDKEELFQELVRTALVPVAERLAAPVPTDVPVRAMLESFLDTLTRNVIGTSRGNIVRLIITEGARFPSLADFYYHEVVSHGVAGMRRLVQLGISRGEIHNRSLLDFPQLIIAPAIGAIVWQSLFAKFAPLDVAGMMRTHIDLIFSEGRAT